MRIALNHTRFGPAGGVEGYLRRLVDRLRRQGHEVHFFGRKLSVPAEAGFAFRRVRCVPFPQALRVLSFAYRSAALIEAEAFDLTFGFGRTFGHDLHRDSSGTFAAFHGSVRESFTRSRLYRRVAVHLERRLYADPGLLHTVAVSSFVKGQIQQRYGIPNARLSVIHNGVDGAQFSCRNRKARGLAPRAEAGVRSGRLVALFVGNDWRRKGLECAIEGLRTCATPWDLWVVGEDAHESEFRRRARDAGLADRVRFFGRRETPSFYAAADAFLLPSLFDPLANVVLEAMASGLPPIVSPADGAAELIRNGENGFVLGAAADTRGLAGFLDALAGPEVRERTGRRAAETAASLTWDHHFELLEAVIDGVRREKHARLTGRSGPPPASRS